MEIIKSFITQNQYYTNPRKITVKGLMLHSIGCPQPRAEVIVRNQNKADVDKAIHAAIDGNTGVTYQTLPWDYRGGHCYKGPKGSGNNTHLGIEMCEPSCIKYTKGASFTCSDPDAARSVVKRTYTAAVELFAYLCTQYNLDPLADGVIISHEEGYSRGIASNHADPIHLWKGLDLPYTMNTFRKDVKNTMATSGGIYNVKFTTIEIESLMEKFKDAGYEINTAPENAIEVTTLKKGTKNSTVKVLQTLLNLYGYKDSANKALDIDGSFGGATQYAVKAFQQDKKLTVDGVVGPSTWNALINP